MISADHHVYKKEKHFSRKRFTEQFFYDLSILWQVLSFVIMTIIGIIEYVVTFTIVKELGGLILSGILIYIVSRYLTLLPTFFAYVLPFIPRKYGLPFLGISIVFSFILIFLI